MARNILILGASYGSLLGTKLLMAGHNVSLVCRKNTADLINREGTEVRIKLRDEKEHRSIFSRDLPGKLDAVTPADVDVSRYDMVGLAMQEPQYTNHTVRVLMIKIAAAKLPCLSIMNMPPLPYLMRIPGIDARACRSCYADATVWDSFDPALLTLCSPDAQAFRPPDEKVNVLQVRLASNFKAARFSSDIHTAILRNLAADTEAARFDAPEGRIELPVKLKLHDSVFVPLAKWAMLIAGNYRCIGKDEMRPIKDAVHGDIEATRAVYDWVVRLCLKLGAAERDLVPFDKYAQAALGLGSPSSAARALFGGAHNIERVDRLVQIVAAQENMRLNVLDEIVARVDARLETNRRTA